jgi:hypothetical protein
MLPGGNATLRQAQCRLRHKGTVKKETDLTTGNSISIRTLNIAYCLFDIVHFLQTQNSSSPEQTMSNAQCTMNKGKGKRERKFYINPNLEHCLLFV